MKPATPAMTRAAPPNIRHTATSLLASPRRPGHEDWAAECVNERGPSGDRFGTGVVTCAPVPAFAVLVAH